MELATLNDAFRKVGLTPRGAFHPEPDDGVPDVKPGHPTATLVLAGNAGPDMWDAFSACRDPARDLLDDWSRDVLAPLAEAFGGLALYPFQKPHLPFQRWAQKAEPCQASPLGMFIHPDYGLWHGYRGAVALHERLSLPIADKRLSPCETCPGKPCLSTCPVHAFSPSGYDVPACAYHLEGRDGADCMELGCRARRACPEGKAARYQPAQTAFHMTAFLKARRKDGSLS
ncbi:MAG: 4Fe-4S dicluster domain-containing protein [Rhodospirillaceae bacterium]|jgi:hypothetical protein|nr:4Fe-4S dicluster domain-containing protein [Rhodospirillaceae bacterium]MBT5514962.1 4Fe-4S dicluster domain-containing protein [Rhodospirillaceae bacterium]MBT6084912.1 4Fe-4S dicluster domain-containing protein [Rhodospirillaceae bacterium]MBT6609336.1 4Fe-4S dicluster domain-containing protein [Rhodospirillaceae bacterium]MBT7249062.1 4Fe-4S dicluster domain-containing protein [Rhodospirillaceae bacterium]